MGIHVQGVTQLRSGRRDHHPTKNRPPTRQFIVSVARGPEVSSLRSIIELCGLRVSVQSYVAPKGPMQCSAASAFDTRSETAATRLGVLRVWASTCLVGAQTRLSNLSAVAVGVTTQ